MSATRREAVDVVVVGLGWTGSIMSKELVDAGLRVVALERGEQRDTYPDFAYPRIADELTYGIRYKLFQNLARETVTLRHGLADRAVPYRRLGAFLPGNGVGGAGVHWNGMHWRMQPYDLKLRSNTLERHGKAAIPEGMTIQDWGVSYEELEPCFDRFEKVCGTAGQAGNLQGRILPGGNPFEAPRHAPYPTSALKTFYSGELLKAGALELGLHPFASPAANCSEAYTNPYGLQLGPCNYCGFCERFGCYLYSKASPQSTILPALYRQANFELRTQAQVIRINTDSSGRKATGVTYIDSQGREVEQPAELVILSAYQLHNVRLLLLSKIGKPYDPRTGEGVVGKNYAYQMNAGVSLFFDKDTHFNPFIGAGGGTVALDDFNSEAFKAGQRDFIGGAYLSVGSSGGRPIQQALLPDDAPTWGSGWKQALRDSYGHSMSLGAEGSNMAYRDCYLDLDPNYRDVHGLPLLRMTFDWKANDIRQGRFMAERLSEIARVLGPRKIVVHAPAFGEHFNAISYQSTHNTGGAIMGEDPRQSVLNKYLQCWDVPNLFVLGASAFPQNMAYNPTGMVGALAYWAAQAIRERYLRDPGPLVDA
ncbi:gluconate 2-dehydrogenase alpha chain [Pseudomonas citronellolis]|uniref:GMC family oxidoreductase n=1 Tax=Pseudomonas citronellolis TaxID=53408 RepID=UPI00209C7B05|nr:GMC family oxidoreductase [Pseudomonas citronellolis]MCP1643039.1 gluconate 2-dehydrogenase alpha chain [Pseudomonas citronellolis]MCP1665829.1 gluconate 2-dehydrogenase alpha chain [Pseudomonas citronellolis]MCP1696738.1 gluconate 2-dehydrogenase alpha chain [Pseudomonas citronellolis]MCP1703520.1 gluconate 2-dehydrogenase alpha chain [Pseudomonas citronellolis]MCP1797654.1 gluconate 2-dehydrogenase alpha chain [Pseudomonas citronellolis]